MCIWSIGLIWVSTYRKMEENTHSGHFRGTCTGTGQSCTGTSSAMFFYFDQRSYFSHNFLISDPI